MGQEGKERKWGVEYVKPIVPDSPSNLKRRKEMWVRALWNIELVNELPVDYPLSYQFEPA